ncbi:hypothetical protein KXW57_003990 [Aspergillus fumigatus]|nr:hypothetical protein KXX58_003266 [Aspergillus fumigatus]KAH3243389.1 hypothetical protein KXW57_003990 [Aspergillus fumigatus]KAH3285425.1 hypothetical protein KXV19_003906 [Aspergillus fumigatus]
MTRSERLDTLIYLKANKTKFDSTILDDLAVQYGVPNYDEHFPSEARNYANQPARKRRLIQDSNEQEPSEGSVNTRVCARSTETAQLLQHRQIEYRYSEAPVTSLSILGEDLADAVKSSSQWKWEREVSESRVTDCVTALLPKDRNLDIANPGTAELPATTHTAAVHSKGTSFNDSGDVQDGEEDTGSPTTKRRRIGDKHAGAGTEDQAFLPARRREMKYMFSNAPASSISHLPEPFRTAVENSQQWRSERSQNLETTSCLASLFPWDMTQDVSFTIWCGHDDGYHLNSVFGMKREITSHGLK